MNENLPIITVWAVLFFHLQFLVRTFHLSRCWISTTWICHFKLGHFVPDIVYFNVCMTVSACVVCTITVTITFAGWRSLYNHDGLPKIAWKWEPRDAHIYRVYIFSWHRSSAPVYYCERKRKMGTRLHRVCSVFFMPLISRCKCILYLIQMCLINDAMYQEGSMHLINNMCLIARCA